MRRIADFEVVRTGTESEALLENELIKRHQPKYNILLKDDKTYPYLKITADEWPTLVYTRNVLDDAKKGRYFSVRRSARRAWRSTSRTFPTAAPTPPAATSISTAPGRAPACTSTSASVSARASARPQTRSTAHSSTTRSTAS
ncbi:MAG: hypothetical protein U0232_23850 [Thermomicrobiales bacterium]